MRIFLWVSTKGAIRSERGVELDLTFFQSQGPWAFLFVILLFYVLKENAKREERLIKCLDALVPQVENMSHDIGEIKEQLSER